MKKIFTLCAFGGAAMCAMAATDQLVVLNSRMLPNGIEQRVVRDARGMISRQYVGKTKAVEASADQLTPIPSHVAFYESFENYKYEYGMNWIPEGWTEVNTEANTPTETQLAHNVNNTWYVYGPGDGVWVPKTDDGDYYAFIHFTYKGQWCDLAAQDEWLISPEVTPTQGDELLFNLAADFFNVYDCDDFDWSHISYPERRVVCNLEILVSEDGKQTWNKVFDLAEDVCAQLSDLECYNRDAINVMYPYQVNIDEYAGKTINVAFRYINVGKDWAGNSMIIDPVIVGGEGSEVNIESVHETAMANGISCENGRLVIRHGIGCYDVMGRKM